MPVTLRQYADVVRTLEREGEQTAANKLARGLPVRVHGELTNFEPLELYRFAERFPALQLPEGQHLFRNLEVLLGTKNRAAATFGKAGYDAIDAGDEFVMLTDQGIRLRSAKFDPRKANSNNINHGWVGPVIAGGGLTLFGLRSSEPSNSNDRP